MTYLITIPAVPVAQPRQRHTVRNIRGKAMAVNYTPKNSPVTAYKAACMLAARSVIRSPLTGPLRVDFMFVMPRPNSKIWKTKPMPREPHTGKGDWDNLAKSTCDALNGLAWRDDAQIYSATVEKWVAAGDELPRVEIRIES